MTLEDCRDLLASAITRACGAIPIGQVRRVTPERLWQLHRGPHPREAGKIGTRYRRSLNDTLESRGSGLRVIDYRKCRTAWEGFLVGRDKADAWPKNSLERAPQEEAE